MKTQTLTILTAALVSSFSVSALAESVRDALENADTDLSLRYRLEQVQDDAFDKDAVASTLKTRLTYQSGSFHDMKVLLEFDDVHVVGEQNYGDSDRPTIADPEGTDLNQAALKYTGIKNTTLILGKQRINLGNQRFVGGVGWRQHEQTYNAITAVNKSLPDTTAIYSFIDQVNHFIETKPDINTEAHVIYIENESIDKHKLTAYAFLYDFQGNSSLSTKTFGARVDGGVGDLGYALEYATQSEYDQPENGTDFDVDYQNLEVSYHLKPVKLLAGIEVLGSDDGAIAFSTPTATKHKFNGWADKFLATPNDGLEDTYLGAIAKVSGVKVKLFYHNYKANEGDNEYGDELDIAVAKKFGKVNALLKYANYRADDDDSREDAQKIWVQVASKF